MQLLFWNTGRASVNAAIVDLIADTGADLIALAEYTDDSISLMHSLRSKGMSHAFVPTIACDRIRILTSYPQHMLHHKRDSDRYTIKEMHIPGSPATLLALVHLPSKLHLGEEGQALRAMITKEEIEQVERDCGHSNTLILGDFNMNPFEKGMISVPAFNALPCIRANTRDSRKVADREYKFFYNPSWNLLGDRNASAGTFFHQSPTENSLYWNTLDQAIMRPALATRFQRNSLRSITVAGGRSLINSRSLPELSDHLPIALSIS